MRIRGAIANAKEFLFYLLLFLFVKKRITNAEK